MKKILSTETELKGTWQLVKGKVAADHVCERIEWLLENQLLEISKDFSGWDTLYKDPDDGRFWELLYLESHLHGGGPPTLRVLSDTEVIKKYGVPVNRR